MAGGLKQWGFQGYKEKQSELKRTVCNNLQVSYSTPANEASLQHST